jgi:phage FluMu protein Com
MEMKMEMKMLVVCPCGVRLNVSMTKYLQMRCPKCHTMLAEEIERQASRNSKAMWDVAAYMARERWTARRWYVNDEVICRLLAKHEIESHGGEWPPKVTQQEDVFKIEIEEEKPVVHTSPLAVDMPVPEPEPPSPKKKISIKVKKNKKGGRK